MPKPSFFKAATAAWDGDKGKNGANPSDNQRLLRLMGEAVEEWPNFAKDKCACFSVNLETTLREEIKSDDFDKWLAECQAEFAIVKPEYAMKNPFVITNVLKKARDAGRESKTLKEIVEKIVASKK